MVNDYLGNYQSYNNDMIISLKRLRKKREGVEEKRDKKWMNDRNENHMIESVMSHSLLLLERNRIRYIMRK